MAPAELILLDTDAVSCLQKGTLSDHLAERLTGRILCLSMITVGELMAWPLVKKWGDGKRDELHRWIRLQTILPIDLRVCSHWATITTELGRPRPKADAWTAATALRFSVPLMTLNVKHFESIAGLNLVR